MSWQRSTRRGDAMTAATVRRIELAGRTIDYRLVRSKSAKKLRVRVGPAGVEVVQPYGRADAVEAFLSANGSWIIDQLRRVERLRNVRMPRREGRGTIL